MHNGRNVERKAEFTDSCLRGRGKLCLMFRLVVSLSGAATSIIFVKGVCRDKSMLVKNDT